MKPPDFNPVDALLIVDMQKDFCPPNGALPVTDCRGVLNELNEWIAAAEQAGITIVASRDWHPPDHSSFQARGGPWPEHCVRGTPGAEFCDEMHLPPRAVLVSKGTAPESDQYSPFESSGLEETLKERGVHRLWIGGVAQEVCVRAAVLDALQAGFEVHVIVEATAPVDEENGRRALDEMQQAGAVLHPSQQAAR